MGRAALMLSLAVLAPIAAAEPERVAFDAPAPYADRGVLAERLLHGHLLERARAVDGAGALTGPSLDPRAERWEVVAPEGCVPERPCGVLVWIHPWDDARAPREWAPVLAEARVVLVAAARSGNSQPTLDRRVPLALHGLAGVRARYAIDPARTWVGGFSGGGRVASRIAVGWPDLFTGALMVATSDWPGSADVPLPGGPLLAALRRGRFVFVVGDADPENLAITREAHGRFRKVCALGAELEVLRDRGHATLDRRGLRRALRLLDSPSGVTATAQQRCEDEVAAEAAAAIAAVRARLAADDRVGARDALLRAHRAWGGLVAAEYAELLPATAVR